MRHSFRRAMRARWTSLVGCEYATPQTSFGKSMNQRPAEIDDPIADIESPARSVDLDTLNRKIANMAKCTSSTATCVRAHAKTCAGMRNWRACGRSNGHRCWPEVLQQRARLALVHAFKRVKLIASADSQVSSCGPMRHGFARAENCGSFRLIVVRPPTRASATST